MVHFLLCQFIIVHLMRVEFLNFSLIHFQWWSLEAVGRIVGHKMFLLIILDCLQILKVLFVLIRRLQILLWILIGILAWMNWFRDYMFVFMRRLVLIPGI